jgi:2-iminobutanoate/2-iminopropanoate deaminase
MHENRNVDGLVRRPAFSHATIADNTIYVSGTIGSHDDQFQPVSGTVGEQTTQALRNLERILEACGASVDDVVKVTVALTDMSTFGEMNEAYVAVFRESPPARATMGVSELVLGASVQIECIAVRQRT